MSFFLKNFLIFIFISFLVLNPAFSLAQNERDVSGGLIPCETSTNPEKCNFSHFLKLINNLINFILFKLAIPICAVMFAYAGFLLISGGEKAAESVTKAKTIFWHAVVGLLICAGAVVIIKTLLSILGYKGSWNIL